MRRDGKVFRLNEVSSLLRVLERSRLVTVYQFRIIVIKEPISLDQPVHSCIFHGDEGRFTAKPAEARKNVGERVDKLFLRWCPELLETYRAAAIDQFAVADVLPVNYGDEVLFSVSNLIIRAKWSMVDE